MVDSSEHPWQWSQASSHRCSLAGMWRIGISQSINWWSCDEFEFCNTSAGHLGLRKTGKLLDVHYLARFFSISGSPGSFAFGNRSVLQGASSLKGSLMTRGCTRAGPSAGSSSSALPTFGAECQAPADAASDAQHRLQRRPFLPRERRVAEICWTALRPDPDME